MNWLDYLELGAYIAVPVAGWAIARASAMRTRMDDLARRCDERLDAHGERLATLEVQTGRISQLHGDISAVHDKINAVAQQTAQVDGRLQAMGATNQAILDALIQRGGEV